MRAVILGVGNILLSDEGMGVHAVNALEQRYELPPEAEAIDGGTSAMDCLDRIASADLLLIADCVRAGREPGALVRIGGDELNAFFLTKISPHQVGISDVLATLNLHGLAPARTVLIGAQPESLALGMELTPTLAAKLPEMVEMLVAELLAAGLELAPRTGGAAAAHGTAAAHDAGA